jgi:hypothetical protein
MFLLISCLSLLLSSYPASAQPRIEPNTGYGRPGVLMPLSQTLGQQPALPGIETTIPPFSAQFSRNLQTADPPLPPCAPPPMDLSEQEQLTESAYHLADTCLPNRYFG